MGRSKREVDELEVEEIINLKLEELCGDKRKLTYNSVHKFNKLIYNNENYIRKNGEKFRNYGYDFWAGSYKGNDYYGKERIDKIKSDVKTIIAGESFEYVFQDIIALVERNKNNTNVMIKKLIRLFEEDRKKITLLKNENSCLQEKLKKSQEDMKLFELSFAILFCNSASNMNSLNNVISLERPHDIYVKEELGKMFNYNEDKINSYLKIEDNEDIKDNIVNINLKKESMIEKERKKLENMGF